MGDGIILENNTEQWVMTEHVSALDVPGPKGLLKGEERVLSAIEHKIAKGHEYAEGKTLVVFLEGAGIWYPNRVGRSITGRHNFNEVCCVALLDIIDGIYSYSVSFFNEKHSPTWKVEIERDFTNWKISRLQ
ncbi:MAG: hypothetical protein Q7S47_01285 [bacterium]|nr:hypothetical protein [bacterium]